MTKTESVIGIIKDISPQTKIDASNTGAELFELGLDSLDHASVLLQIEETFGVKIPDEDSEKLVTVDAIVKFIDQRSAGA
jgi:acyl carrier protein